MTHDDLVLNVEAALLSAGRPVALDELVAMFEGRKDVPDRSAVREAVATLTECWRGRALELSEVASGYRAQIRKEYSESIAALWQERPARYSRALLETLALIAYRQPVSRGEIEEVRGVTVSSSIMKTLLEREWVRVVGHRETPGRPALYGTTKQFLDTFNLKNLEALPPLAELRDLDDPPPDLFTGLQDAVDDGEEVPVDGEEVAIDGEEVAIDGEEVAIDGEEVAIDGEEVAIDGEEVAIDGEEVAIDGEEVPVDGEEVPVDGEEVAIDGEEVAIDGEEVAIDGEEVAVDGEEAAIDGEEAAIDGAHAVVDENDGAAYGEDAVVDGVDESQPSAIGTAIGASADGITTASGVGDTPSAETSATDGSTGRDPGPDTGGGGPAV